jgi:SAM-dependent methyltransferase
MKPNRTRVVPSALALTIALLVSSVAFSAEEKEKKPFEPRVGQSGKDVIWVPTDDAIVTKMLDMAKVTDKDYVIDLGSGDGRIVIAAAKRGARALGVEYNPDMIELSKTNAKKAGVAEKTTFEKADIFKTDFSKATVITMYLLPDLNLRLRPTILKMKPGTRIVSHDFDMGDWEADESANLDTGSAYFWLVPADAQGTWTFQTPAGAAAELAIKQTYQKIEPTLKIGGKEAAVKDAKLQGDKISFTVVEGKAESKYSGAVDGDTITGTGDTKWAAKRRAAP